MVYVQYICSKVCGTLWVVMMESHLAQIHMHLCLTGAQIINKGLVAGMDVSDWVGIV